MLITTGRNPGRESREIANALFAAIPESRLEGRGRRTLSSLVSKARKLHFTRICAIHRSEGRPCTISFLSVDDEGKWAWLSPKIKITNVKIPAGKLRVKPDGSEEGAGEDSKSGAAALGATGTEPAAAASGTVLAQSRCLAISGAKASVFRLLADPVQVSDEPESKIEAGASKLAVYSHGKKILEMGVEYES